MEEQEKTNEDNVQLPDFYVEDGLVVFTREFLLKRGYCCKCGCRHCPYRVKSDE